MAINGITYGTSSVLNQSVLNLKNQMTILQSQLTSGEKSTTYAGMGVNEGFAIAARSQLSNISAFTDTMTNINTDIGIANTGLQSMVDIGNTMVNAANSTMQTLNSSGQTIAQTTAYSQLSSMLGVLNLQAGDRYLFSGSAINTPAVAPIDTILNGTTTQAGLKQVISERQQADLGTNGLGRLIINSPTATSVQVVEDAAGSPFGLKLSAVSSSLTGATVTGPAGSPSGVSINLGANPNDGDKVNFSFNLPDGTTESIQLTASSATPPPTGSFAIGLTPAATTANLNAALTTAIGTLANTSLVAASAIQAGNDFFDQSATVTGSGVTNKAAPASSISGTTLLSGGAGTNSLGTSFAPGDTITVNGTPITFVTSGATGNQVNVTDSVQTLLTKIDSITGTSTPSTVTDGVITLHNDTGSGLTVSSSNSAGFAALGFGAVASQPPLGIAGTAVNNQATTPAPITGATLLSGAAGTDSLAASFGLTDTITVNGTSISFVAAGATGNQLNLSDSVQTMLAKIDSITGTTVPSTVSNGVITLRSNAGSSLTVTTTNSAAFTALGLNTPSTATLPPLQVAGSVATNKAAGQISGATLLSGGPSTNSLSTNFAAGNTITVNGTTISFNSGSGTSGSAAAGTLSIDVTAPGSTVASLLTAIDAITGTTVPSTINNGVITLNSSSGAKLSVTSTNAAAFAALGLGAAAPASVPPLRVSGSPLGTATSLVSGTPANTVTWYTGQTGPGSARASATSRVDQSVTVQYGIRANEQAIRSQLQTLAVFASVTTSPTNPNAALAVQALSQRVTQNLQPQAGQQTIEDIQADLATAQATMSDAGARQTQSKAMLQNLVDQAETVSTDQVASEILALQTSLQASYQTTSMLSQLTLTKYLPVG
jgi:flagellar hook-associated protein 3 FlgL